MSEGTPHSNKKLSRTMIIAGVSVLVLLVGAGVTTKVVIDKNFAEETIRLCAAAGEDASKADTKAANLDIELEATFAEGLADIDEIGGHAYADKLATDAVEAVEADGDIEDVEAIEARLSGAEYIDATQLAWTDVEDSFDGYRKGEVECFTRDDVERINAHTADQRASVATLIEAHDALTADYAIWAEDEAIRIEAERIAAEKAAAEAAAAEAARIEAERVAAENSYSGNGYVEGGSNYDGGGSSGGSSGGGQIVVPGGGHDGTGYTNGGA